jgi:hypothetical protein
MIIAAPAAASGYASCPALPLFDVAWVRRSPVALRASAEIAERSDHQARGVDGNLVPQRQESRDAQNQTAGRRDHGPGSRYDHDRKNKKRLREVEPFGITNRIGGSRDSREHH